MRFTLQFTSFLFIVTVAVAFGSCGGRLITSQSLGSDRGLGSPTSTPAIEPLVSSSWKRAKFRGLSIGESKSADLENLLGKSLERVINRDEKSKQTFVVFTFKVNEPFTGTLMVDVLKSSQVIQHAELTPDSAKKDDILKYFGDDYIVTRYDFDECLGDFDSTPLYESPTGTISSLEYRDKGIAIALSEDGEEVRFISYLSKPLGAVTSKCKKE